MHVIRLPLHSERISTTSPRLPPINSYSNHQSSARNQCPRATSFRLLPMCPPRLEAPAQRNIQRCSVLEGQSYLFRRQRTIDRRSENIYALIPCRLQTIFCMSSSWRMWVSITRPEFQLGFASKLLQSTTSPRAPKSQSLGPSDLFVLSEMRR